MTDKIDPEAVEAVLKDCLYREEEAPELVEVPLKERGGRLPEGCVQVGGILSSYGFHPQRLESHREQVKEWLALLPTEFRKTGGGGWSFLNACYQANGEQWTGLHVRMEQLFCLAIGLELAAWRMPRDMWSVLPEGMPYVVIYI